jgi:hypothetical protein
MRSLLEPEVFVTLYVALPDEAGYVMEQFKFGIDPVPVIGFDGLPHYNESNSQKTGV